MIAKHYLFSRLPPGAISKAIGILKVINAETNDVIIRSGDRSHMMFIFCCGTVRARATRALRVRRCATAAGTPDVERRGAHRETRRQLR